MYNLDVSLFTLLNDFLQHFPLFTDTISVIIFSACHEVVNIMPFYNTCLKYLNSLRGDRHASKAEESNTHHDSEVKDTGHFVPSASEPPSANTPQNMKAERINHSNSTIYEINIKDVLFQLTEEQNVFTGASLQEISVLCDVAAAYASSCSRHRVELNLPALCGKGQYIICYFIMGHDSISSTIFMVCAFDDIT